MFRTRDKMKPSSFQSHLLAITVEQISRHKYCFCILRVQTKFIKQIRSDNTLFIIRIDSQDITYRAYLLTTIFFNFGLFTSSSSRTWKLTAGSLCNTFRLLDVSANTAVDFATEELLSTRMMSRGRGYFLVVG